MRGKVSAHRPRFPVSRITPAYAGKRYSPARAAQQMWDHPRLCGEKKITRSGGSTLSGSPPPMRGKACKICDDTSLQRITPAYAGKRLRDTERGTATQDHPRLCGEKYRSIRQQQQHVGSPPPMRGKVLFTFPIRIIQRITPAYAGKSMWNPATRESRGDHPRLCGEKLFAPVVDLPLLGSPPPMRGKEGRAAAARQVRGITPAYAGKRKKC